MNVVNVTGTAATEFDVRDLGDGRKVGNFLLAIDRPGEDKGADFVRVTAWNELADRCAREVVKGIGVQVDGRLRSRSWTGADGKRRNAVEVVASTVRTKERSRAEAPFEASVA